MVQKSVKGNIPILLIGLLFLFQTTIGSASVPDPPTNLRRTQAIDLTTFVFRWDPPAVTNGVLTAYIISCEPQRNGLEVLTSTVDGSVTTATIFDFASGVEYICTAKAQNNAGVSLPSHTTYFYTNEQVRELLYRLGHSRSECQGVLLGKELQYPDDPYFAICSTSLGDIEASVLCRQMGCEARGAKMVQPSEYGYVPTYFSYLFGILEYSCDGNENRLSECTELFDVPSECASVIEPIAIQCGKESPPNVRLVGGIHRCTGRMEYRPSPDDPFQQACNTRYYAPEARVACRELGCTVGIEDARRVSAVKYGYSETTDIGPLDPFIYRCSGDEQSFDHCSTLGRPFCLDNDEDSIIAIECGTQPTYRLRNFKHPSGPTDGCEGIVLETTISAFNDNSSPKFGASCDREAGESEAQAICNEVGCNPLGARRVDPTAYHDRITLLASHEGIPFIGFGYKCDGSEDSVSECTIRAPVHDPMNVKPKDIFAVQCGAGPNQGRGR